MTENKKPNLKLSGVISFIVALILFVGNQFLGTSDDGISVEPGANETILVERSDEEPEDVVVGEPEAQVETANDSPDDVELDEADSDETLFEEVVIGDVDAEDEAEEAEPVLESVADVLLWADADIDFDYYMLALSWQSAFCETRPGKPECVSQTDGRYDATHFVLHGLWPSRFDDPSNDFAYCGQSKEIINQDRGDWCELPDMSLSDEIVDDLALFMPGAVSCLDKHEWYKHGTCAGMSDDAYFALSNELVELFGQTGFNRYVADNIGQEVSRRDVLDAFSAEFGEENLDHLTLRCNEVDGFSLLSEIRIALKTDILELNDFTELFPDDYVRPSGNCPRSFYIDDVG